MSFVVVKFVFDNSVSVSEKRVKATGYELKRIWANRSKAFPTRVYKFRVENRRSNSRRKAKVEHAATFADGVKVEKVLDAAHKSDKTRKMINVSDLFS